MNILSPPPHVTVGTSFQIRETYWSLFANERQELVGVCHFHLHIIYIYTIYLFIYLFFLPRISVSQLSLPSLMSARAQQGEGVVQSRELLLRAYSHVIVNFLRVDTIRRQQDS